MKIKYFICLTIVSLLILLVKKTYNKNNFDFDRKGINKDIYKSNDFNSIHNIKEHDFIFQTDSFLFYYEKGNEISHYNWTVFDLKNNHITSNGNITLYNPLIFFYYQNNICYFDNNAIIIENLKNKEKKTLSSFSGEPYSAYPLSNNRLLVLGSFKFREKYETGFYEISVNDGSLKQIKPIETIHNPVFIQKNCLIYSGYFVQSKNYIIYYCDKQSQIFIFNLDGSFLKHFKSKDNVPKPIISTFNNTYIYKRKQTFRSNIGMYEKNDILYILSYRCSKQFIVLDKYSVKTEKYIGSIFLHDIRVPNKNVNSLFGIENNIILNTKNEFIVLELNSMVSG